MDKSLIESYIKDILNSKVNEALTPDQASKVKDKYKQIYSGMLKGDKKNLLKYIDPKFNRPNPDAMATGRAINLVKKESKLSEKLGKDADLGDHIEDFQKSNAKQFQGKSKKKINQMATAAFLNKEEQNLDEIMEEDKTSEDKLEKIIKSVLKKEGGAAGLDPLKKAVKGEETDEDFDIEKFIKKLDSVEKHRDGDYILKETGEEIAKKNMDMYKDKNKENSKLSELIKSALKGPVKEKEESFPDLTGDGKVTKADILKGRGVKLEEGTDLVDKHGYQFTRFSMGEEGPGLQITGDYKSYITIPGSKLGVFASALTDAIRAFDDMSRQLPVDEDVVKGSNIKKVGDDWRILSGKTGKMWKQKYDSKKDAEAGLKGYFASQNESLAEIILKELRK